MKLQKMLIIIFTILSCIFLIPLIYLIITNKKIESILEGILVSLFTAGIVGLITSIITFLNYKEKNKKEIVSLLNDIYFKLQTLIHLVNCYELNENILKLKVDELENRINEYQNIDCDYVISKKLTLIQFIKFTIVPAFLKIMQYSSEYEIEIINRKLFITENKGITESELSKFNELVKKDINQTLANLNNSIFELSSIVEKYMQIIDKKNWNLYQSAILEAIISLYVQDYNQEYKEKYIIKQ